MFFYQIGIKNVAIPSKKLISKRYKENNDYYLFSSLMFFCGPHIRILILKYFQFKPLWLRDNGGFPLLGDAIGT